MNVIDFRFTLEDMVSWSKAGIGKCFGLDSKYFKLCGPRGTSKNVRCLYSKQEKKLTNF